MRTKRELRYDSLRVRGLCVRCKRSTCPGKSECLDCAAKRREWKKVWREKNKKKISAEGKERLRELRALGLCMSCGQDAQPGRVLCQVHLAKEQARGVLRRKRKRALGLCMSCGQDAQPGRAMCQVHLDKKQVRDAIRREYIRKAKKEWEFG